MLELNFIEVTEDYEEGIDIIYEILKKSGEHLFNSKGLYHWKNPYPKDSIRENVRNRKVYIVKNMDTGKFIHTFQLEVRNTVDLNSSLVENVAEINKFATLPEEAGKGIGTRSINFIEKYCIKNNIKKIELEVYDKSLDAVNFYKSKGLVIKGERETRYFKVFRMEKVIIQINNNTEE